MPLSIPSLRAHADACVRTHARIDNRQIGISHAHAWDSEGKSLPIRLPIWLPGSAIGNGTGGRWSPAGKWRPANLTRGPAHLQREF
jgi:hypothetical protein